MTYHSFFFVKSIMGLFKLPDTDSKGVFRFLLVQCDGRISSEEQEEVEEEES